MALTKVRGKGLGTLGDGTASDNSIVFDGNAQDFHIGLDDSEDKLTIGLGSTLGTTAHMTFDANGHILMPLQSSVGASATQMNNFSSEVTIDFDQERFDQNSDYDTSSKTFTAPVTGRYLITVHLTLDVIDSNANYYQLTLATSNRNYQATLDPDYFDDDQRYFPLGLSVLADMDASDTALCKIVQSGGATQTDLLPESFVSYSLQM